MSTDASVTPTVRFGIRINNAKDKTDEGIEWFNSLFTAVVAISSLGAGFTFTIIFSDPAVPSNRNIEDENSFRDDVRFLLSISWVCFVVALAVVSTASVLFSAANVRYWILDRWNKQSPWPHIVVTLTFLAVLSCPTAAFMLASWAVSLYYPIIGYFAFGFCGCFGTALHLIVCARDW